MKKRWIIHRAKSKRYRKRVWKQRHNHKRSYGSGNLGAKEFIFSKDGKSIKVKDYEVGKINQLLLSGYKIKQDQKQNLGSLGSRSYIEGTNEDVLDARRLAMKMKTPEAALRAVRRTFDKPEELECVEASCALLDPIKKFYPDAELVKLSVKRPGMDATDSHTVIISDKANKIIDSQAGQFKGRIKLSDNFIDKGVYNIDEYSQNIPFIYAERVNDDKRIDLFKILKKSK